MNSKIEDFNAAASVTRANTNGLTLHCPLREASCDCPALGTELVQQDVLSGKCTLDFKSSVRGGRGETLYNTCWRGRGEIGTLVRYWRECEMVQPPWTIVIPQKVKKRITR